MALSTDFVRDKIREKLQATHVVRGDSLGIADARKVFGGIYATCYVCCSCSFVLFMCRK